MTRTRTKINLELKLEVLKRFDSGQKASHIARELGLARRTVGSMCVRDINQIRACAKTALPLQSKQITTIKSTIKIQMESLLVLWMENQIEEGLPVSKTSIQNKALSLFNEIRAKVPSSNRECLEYFEASDGWFIRFKNRFNLHSIPFPLKEKSSSADDSTQEFTKGRPLRSYIFKSETSEDHQSTHLKQNTESDFQFNPLDYSSENTGTPENEEQNEFPVWKVKTVVNNQSDVVPDVIADMVPDVKTLTTAHTSKALQLITEAMDIFYEHDPDKNRSSKVIRSMAESVNGYRIYLEREVEKIQQTLDNFLIKSRRQTHQPTEMDTDLDPLSL